MQDIDWNREGDAEEIIKYLRGLPIEVVRERLELHRQKPYDSDQTTGWVIVGKDVPE